MTSHILDSLRAALPLVEPYPEGVLPIPEFIPGTAFFPGGDGVWKEEGPVPFPVDGVMVVGHNFDSVKGYKDSHKKGKENLNGSTWGRTRLLLSRSGIDPKGCFFTNFYMGLIDGDKAMGPFPGRTDKEFVRRCQQFFLLQVALLQPRLIIVYGLQVPPLLAPLSPQLEKWKNLKSVADLDRVGVVGHVQFGSGHTYATVVGLIHPSMAASNLRFRENFDQLQGHVEENILMSVVSSVLSDKSRPKPTWATPFMHWEGLPEKPEDNSQPQGA